MKLILLLTCTLMVCLQLPHSPKPSEKNWDPIYLFHLDSNCSIYYVMSQEVWKSVGLKLYS